MKQWSAKATSPEEQLEQWVNDDAGGSRMQWLVDELKAKLQAVSPAVELLLRLTA
jgi:hypothetical protein